MGRVAAPAIGIDGHQPPKAKIHQESAEPAEPAEPAEHGHRQERVVRGRTVVVRTL